MLAFFGILNIRYIYYIYIMYSIHFNTSILKPQNKTWWSIFSSNRAAICRRLRMTQPYCRAHKHVCFNTKNGIYTRNRGKSPQWKCYVPVIWRGAKVECVQSKLHAPYPLSFGTCHKCLTFENGSCGDGLWNILFWHTEI